MHFWDYEVSKMKYFSVLKQELFWKFCLSVSYLFNRLLYFWSIFFDHWLMLTCHNLSHQCINIQTLMKTILKNWQLHIYTYIYIPLKKYMTLAKITAQWVLLSGHIFLMAPLVPVKEVWNLWWWQKALMRDCDIYGALSLAVVVYSGGDCQQFDS